MEKQYVFVKNYLWWFYFIVFIGKAISNALFQKELW